jgi:hypothetical protein
MPAAWAGVSQVIVVSLTTVNDVAASVSNNTPVEPVKPEPLIVTEVPPPIKPSFGDRLVTVIEGKVSENLRTVSAVQPVVAPVTVRTFVHVDKSLDKSTVKSFGVLKLFV